MSGRNITTWTATSNNIAAVHTHSIKTYENATAVWSEVKRISFSQEGLANLDAAQPKANAVLAELKQASRPTSPEEAAIHIGYMITSFDTFGDVSIRTDRMLDFVLRAEPTIGDLIQACINLITTRDKTPSVHQVIEAIAEAKQLREDLIAQFSHLIELPPYVAAIVAANGDIERESQARNDLKEAPHYETYIAARDRERAKDEQWQATLRACGGRPDRSW
jgi:hypothetical protein